MTEQEPVRTITIINPIKPITTRTAPPDWRPGYVPTTPAEPASDTPKGLLSIYGANAGSLCRAYLPDAVVEVRNHPRGSRQVRSRNPRPVA